MVRIRANHTSFVMTYRIIQRVLFLAVVAVAHAAVAQEPEEGLAFDVDHEEHHYHRHHVGVFLGGATRFADGSKTETGAALGLDYEYRFSKRWGIGGVAEAVVFSDEHRDGAFAVPVYFHPTQRLKLSAGPGFEIEDGHAEFMARFSVTYDIPVWKLILSPEVSLDVLDRKQVLLYGLTIGAGF